MQYINIFKQAWRIIKKTKLLWLIGVYYFIQPFLNLNLATDPGFRCLIAIISFINLFIYFFAGYAVVLTAEKVIQNTKPDIKEIWAEFKHIFWKLVLFWLMVTLYAGMVCLAVFLVIVIYSWIFHITFLNFPERIYITVLLAGPFCIGLTKYSYFGLVTQKLPIRKSISHGLTVHTEERKNGIVLYIIFAVYDVLSFLLVWSIFIQQRISWVSIYNSSAFHGFPQNIIISALMTISFLFNNMSFLILYHQIIERTSNPDLKPRFSKVNPVTV